MTERRDFLGIAALASVAMLEGSEAASAANPPGTKDAKAEAPIKKAPDKNSSPEKVQEHGPIHEESFGDYHLLGKPDPTANLFGEVRPKDWKSTKQLLETSLRATAPGGDPIHDWLKTFDTGFDGRTTDVVVKAAGQPNVSKYEPQLYEILLRSAGVLLDRCLRYRNDMERYEISGVSAGIGYLTFLKLKPLQRNFLAKSNLADLAQIAKTTNARASQKYAEVWFQDYEVQAKQIEAAGDATEAGAAEVKDNFLTSLLEKQFNIQTDAQLAQFTRLLQPGSSSNFAERYLRLLSMLTEDLADVYYKLYSASKGIQQVLGLNQVTVGLDTPIAVDIPLFQTAAAVKTWVDQIVPSQGNQRTPDIVDALVLWNRAVIRTLETAAQYESEFTVSIPLNQPWHPGNATMLSAADMNAAFATATPTGSVSFTLPNTCLPIAVGQSNIRVVGLGLSVEHSQDDASPLQYTTNFPHTPSNPAVAVGQTPAPSQEPTPQQIGAAQQYESIRLARLNATITTPAQTKQGGGSYSRPKVFLSNVRIQGGGGGDLEPILSYDPACRGLNPFGAWTIAFDPTAVAFFQANAPIPINWVTGLILHLRLRGTLN
ncbi:hypothetical protein [Bradyrhizobium sp. CCGUVB14]|uniref:hypothetical protein n=1 Tax=Bradyrhizobium sp. CCGUVB14 TaxID=2949628 RepID=UPI0020B24E56|nr:hypothetical protein [Bradyrhizobium sp. CCGUVB14]MCP3442007.1 hypothetical protein [Bradyrhizobium sp. CCGUVB14]